MENYINFQFPLQMWMTLRRDEVPMLGNLCQKSLHFIVIFVYDQMISKTLFSRENHPLLLSHVFFTCLLEEKQNTTKNVHWFSSISGFFPVDFGWLITESNLQADYSFPILFLINMIYEHFYRT